MNVTMREWVILNNIVRIISKEFNQELYFNTIEYHWDMDSNYCRRFRVDSSSVLEVSKNITTYLTNNIPNLTDKYDFGLRPEVIQKFINQLTLVCINTDPKHVVMNPADIRLEKWFNRPDLKESIRSIDWLIRLESIANKIFTPNTVIPEKIHELYDLWIDYIGLNKEERCKLHQKNVDLEWENTGSNTISDAVKQSDNAPDDNTIKREESFF